MISQRGHPNCFGVVHLPVLLATKDPEHPCSPWSSRSSLYFMGKMAAIVSGCCRPNMSMEKKDHLQCMSLLVGEFLQSPWAANIKSCSSKISKWWEKWHSRIGLDNHFIIPFHEFRIQSPSLNSRSPRRGCYHVEWRAQSVRKQGVTGWERIDGHLVCVLHKWVPLLEPSKVYLNAVMGAWGLTGMYEGVPALVWNLIQHTWFKDLNRRAWGLKSAHAAVSEFGRLMANLSADCLFWSWTFDSDYCFKRDKEENVQEVRWQ